ncbi:MAG: hypothetical protein EA376_05995 [Phycisphaeraceae bacterium]|nr:MAG: hypothetical protein EA376_05995 [Phycisphaeraceae bacterium]
MKNLFGFGTAAALGLLACVGASSLPGATSTMTLDQDASSEELPEFMRNMVAVCYAEGAPSDVVEAVETGLYGLGQRFFTTGRWPGSVGEPVNLTYSFPPDGLNIPASGGIPGEVSEPNVIHDRLNTIFASQGGEVFWKDLFRQTFDAWSAVTGNTYTEVPDDGASWGAAPGSPDRGDIRIAMKGIDGFGGVLAYNFFPSGGGNMVLDRAENWGASAANFRFLRNTVMHEHGHGLGLLHSCPGSGQTGGNTRLMQPTIATNFDGPQQDDIRGAHSLYGDALSPINSIATALDLNDLGLTVNVPFVINNTLSLRNFNDTDNFRVDAPPSSRLSVTVTPIGTTYLNGPQNSNGTCSAGTPLDALRQQDLRIQILSPSGSVITTVDQNGLGEPEMLESFNLGVEGVYTVRIGSSNSDGNVQRYNLSITLEPDGVLGDLNGDNCVGSADLSILLGSWGPCPAPPNACIADLTGNGSVGSADLSTLLGNWGGECN